MAVAAATQEIQFETQTPELRFEPVPKAIDVACLPGDQECINRAQQNINSRRVGTIALTDTIEAKQKPIRNGKEALIWAETGDEDGLRMLDSNILKEATEYMFKAGNISEVNLDTDSQGRILQNGQLMDDVYRNGWQLASAHPIIKERSLAESNNGARLEKFNREGVLDTHVLMVISRATEGLSDEEMDELNFFSETKSLSIQATTQTDEGLKTETAFVAGVKNSAEDRNDGQVIEAIYEYFGVNISGKTAEQIIDMPLLIPKEYMENGVIDIVRLYDDINGGTFFGQDKPRQEYLEHKQFCEEREATFSDDVISVRDQLIVENGQLKDAVAVSKRLAKLVEERLVKLAVSDESIDASVFGKVSAENITAARMHGRMGNYEQAMMHAQTAIRTATGGSCPSSLENLAKLLGGDQEGVAADSDEDCEFISKSCPECGAKNVRTKSTKTRISGSCGCSVSK